MQSSVDFSKKAAADAKVGVTAMVEKSKADSYARRMKKYNPMFPDRYKTKTLELAGSSSATMSQKTACAIDGAIGKLGGAKGGSSMDAQAAKEHHSKLHFHIEF